MRYNSGGSTTLNLFLGHISSEKIRERQDAWKQLKDFLQTDLYIPTNEDAVSIIKAIMQLLQLESKLYSKNELPLSTIQANKQSQLLRDVRQILSIIDSHFPSVHMSPIVCEFTLFIYQATFLASFAEQRAELCRLVNLFIFSKKPYILACGANLDAFLEALLQIVDNATQCGDARLCQEIIKTLACTVALYSSWNPNELSGMIAASFVSLLLQPSIPTSFPHFSSGIKAINYFLKTAKTNIPGNLLVQVPMLIIKSFASDIPSVLTEAALLYLENDNLLFSNDCTVELERIFTESRLRLKIFRKEHDPFEHVNAIIEYAELLSFDRARDENVSVLFWLCYLRLFDTKLLINFATITEISFLDDYTVLLICLFSIRKSPLWTKSFLVKMKSLFEIATPNQIDVILAIMASAIVFGHAEFDQIGWWVTTASKLLQRPNSVGSVSVFLSLVLKRFPQFINNVVPFDFYDFISPIRRPTYLFLFDHFICKYRTTFWTRSAKNALERYTKHFLEEIQSLTDRRLLMERWKYYLDNYYRFISCLFDNQTHDHFHLPSSSIQAKVFGFLNDPLPPSYCSVILDHNSKEHVRNLVVKFIESVKAFISSLDQEMINSFVEIRYGIQPNSNFPAQTIILLPFLLLTKAQSTYHIHFDLWRSHAFVKYIYEFVHLSSADLLPSMVDGTQLLQFLIQSLESAKAATTAVTAATNTTLLQSEGCDNDRKVAHMSNITTIISWPFEPKSDTLSYLLKTLCYFAIQTPVYSNQQQTIINDLRLYLVCQLSSFICRPDLIDVIFNTFLKYDKITDRVFREIIQFCQKLLGDQLLEKDSYSFLICIGFLNPLIDHASIENSKELASLIEFMIELLKTPKLDLTLREQILKTLAKVCAHPECLTFDQIILSSIIQTPTLLEVTEEKLYIDILCQIDKSVLKSFCASPIKKFSPAIVYRRIYFLALSAKISANCNFVMLITKLVKELLDSFGLDLLSTLKFPSHAIEMLSVCPNSKIICFILFRQLALSLYPFYQANAQFIPWLARFFDIQDTVFSEPESFGLLLLLTSPSEALKFIPSGKCLPLFKAGFPHIMAIALLKHFNGQQPEADFILGSLLKQNLGVAIFEKLLCQHILDIVSWCFYFAESGDTVQCTNRLELTNNIQPFFACIEAIKRWDDNSFDRKLYSTETLIRCLGHLATMFKYSSPASILSDCYLSQLLLIMTRRIESEIIILPRHLKSLVFVLSFWNSNQLHQSSLFINSWVPILQKLLLRPQWQDLGHIETSKSLLLCILKLNSHPACIHRCLTESYLNCTDDSYQRQLQTLLPNEANMDGPYFIKTPVINLDGYCLDLLLTCDKNWYVLKFLSKLASMTSFQPQVGWSKDRLLKLKSKFSSICKEFEKDMMTKAELVNIAIWLDSLDESVLAEKEISQEHFIWSLNDMEFALKKLQRNLESSNELDTISMCIRAAFLLCNSSSCQKSFAFAELSTDIQKSFQFLRKTCSSGKSLVFDMSSADADGTIKQSLLDFLWNPNLLNFAQRILSTSLCKLGQNPILSKLGNFIKAENNLELINEILPRILCKCIIQDEEMCKIFQEICNELLDLERGAIPTTSVKIITYTIFTIIYQQKAGNWAILSKLGTNFNRLAFHLENIDPLLGIFVLELSTSADLLAKNSVTLDQSLWSQLESSVSGEVKEEKIIFDKKVLSLLSKATISTSLKLDSEYEHAFWRNQQWDIKDIPPTTSVNDTLITSLFCSFVKEPSNLSALLKETTLTLNILDPSTRALRQTIKLLTDSACNIMIKGPTDLVFRSLLFRKQLSGLVERNAKDEFYQFVANTLLAAHKSGDGSLVVENLFDVLSASQSLNDPVIRFVGAQACGKLLWKRGKFEAAVEMARESLNDTNGNLPAFSSIFGNEVVSMGWARLAKWLSISKSERPATIMSQFLSKAIEFSGSASIRSKISFKVARFVDQQYERLFQSENLEARERILKKSKFDLDVMKQLVANKQQSESYLRAYNSLEVQYRTDQSEYEQLVRDRNTFLFKAIEYYLKAMSASERYDFSVFRFCSLWLANRNLVGINELVEKYIDGKVPSYKFLPLIYQLAARIEAIRSKSNNVTELFQMVLEKLLYFMTSQHPYHTVYQVLSIRSSGSLSALGSKRRIVGSPTDENGQDRRAQAAANLIFKLKAGDGLLSQRISNIESLCTAYIELAAVELSAETKTNISIPFESKWAIKRMNNLKDVAVPTKLIPIDQSGKYKDIISIVGFGDSFKVVGGINLPKVVECMGSNGIAYKQLVKGKDDVRQDAVMEQVFRMVDLLLEGNEYARNKGLGLRTFRVIPLHPLAGLLEWVSETMPIGDYLLPAHERLRAGLDISVREARQIMKREFERPGSNPATKFKVYQHDVCAKFQPIFRFFFWETTTNPSEWYNKRRNFSSSVAASSMVGYIVGLGDRHCQNILIDKKTGQVVHIDLNMIFEAGKTLRIPERVPFRLTRDMVDGLGPSFTELNVSFSFLQDSEATMTLLRKQHENIIMIMEVFKYDPLYRWTIAPLKAAKRMLAQGETLAPGITSINTIGNNSAITIGTHRNDNLLEEEDSKEADRALLRIREKLLGLEDAANLSERGQVRYLVQMATNPELLCQMYPGWQPWI